MQSGQSILHRAIIAATGVVISLMLFTIGRNLVHALSIRGQISQMEHKADTYRQQIQRDSTLIEELKHNDKLEKYAREHYRMQRRGERVFVVEE